MEDFKTKTLFSSKTIIGIATMLIGSFGVPLAAKAGLTVTAADTQEVIGLVSNGVQLVGAALAVYGRIVATKRIG